MGVGLLVVGLDSPAAAAARGAVAAPAAEEGAAALDGERRALLGDDDNAAVKAAKTLGGRKSGAATDALLEVLSTGTTPAVAEAALGALGASADEKAWDTLALYAGHHNPVLRKAALRALTGVKGSKGAGAEDAEARGADRTSTLLVGALGDADADVRAAAAEVLAARGDRAGLSRMMALLRDNEPGVAEPLGVLATPALIPQIGELLGAVNDEVLANTLGSALKRKDLAEPLRVDVVRTLAKIAGVTSTGILADFMATGPGKSDKPSKKEAQKVLDERSRDR